MIHSTITKNLEKTHSTLNIQCLTNVQILYQSSLHLKVFRHKNGYSTSDIFIVLIANFSQLYQLSKITNRGL